MKRLILIISFLYFAIHDALSQCAMCKATAESQAEDDGSSINTGIIYIMVIPYIIIFSVLFVVFRKNVFVFFKSLKNRDF
jgi:uncharacterized protein (DUF983 family)